MKRSMIAMVGVVAVMLLASMVSANQLIVTGSTGQQYTDFDTVVSMAQFDPSLGTLNSVTVTITASLTGGLKYENTRTTSFTGGTVKAFWDQELNIVQGSTALLHLENNTISTAPPNPDYWGVPYDKIVLAALPAYDGTTDYAGTSGRTTTIWTASSNANPVISNTLPYVGTGLVDFNAASNTLVGMMAPGSLDFGNFSYGQVDVAVTYDYTVPEPATMSLLGLGLVGLIARRRRK